MRTVLLLSQYFKPEIGAPQTRLWETAKGLQQRGWKVIVITAMPNYPSGKIEKVYKGKFRVTEHLEGIQINRFWLYASNSKKTLPRIVNMLSFALMVLFSAFKVHKIKPAFIITESPPLPLGISGIMLAKISGAKHILNVSDLWPLSAFELGAIRKGNLYKFLEYVESWLYKNSFACTGQSNEIIEAVKTNGAQITQLYRNGVTVSRFNPQSMIPIQHQPIKIVYTGLLGVAQGILELSKKIPFASLGFEFHIYGDGAERMALEEYIQHNPDCGVSYHSKVNADEIPSILSQYHMTLIPLITPIYGAIPSKIYESMAAGLPILFAGGGEGAQLVKQYQTGWICNPGDYENMKRILQQLTLLDDEEWKTLKANCVSTSILFDRSTQIDNLHQFLEQHLCI